MPRACGPRNDIGGVFAELDYLSLTWNESPKWACAEVSFEDLDAELLQAYAERSDFSQIHICPPMRYIIADD